MMRSDCQYNDSIHIRACTIINTTHTLTRSIYSCQRSNCQHIDSITYAHAQYTRLRIDNKRIHSHNTSPIRTQTRPILISCHGRNLSVIRHSSCVYSRSCTIPAYAHAQATNTHPRMRTQHKRTNTQTYAQMHMHKYTQTRTYTNTHKHVLCARCASDRAHLLHERGAAVRCGQHAENAKLDAAGPKRLLEIDQPLAAHVRDTPLER